MALDVTGLTFGYPGREVLHGINLRVEPGRLTCLLGPSGSGKSTLLRCISGLEQSYHGSIQLDGASLDGLQPHQRSVGMVMQDGALFPHLSVEQNVAFGLRYKGFTKASERLEANRWLALVGLADRATDSVDQLSGGQRQRVALARTLAARPRAVLLDEPLGALDQEMRAELGGRLRDVLRDQNVPAIWVTHDENEAATWGDENYRMLDGVLEPVPRASG